MSWASWVFAQAKNWLLPVWMPLYGHCVASNTALQSSPPPCLPSSLATTRSSSPEREQQLTIDVVLPPHHHCPGQYPKHNWVPGKVDSSSTYATSSSSKFSSRSSSPATTRSSSPEREQQLMIGVVCPPHHHCPGLYPKHNPVPRNVDSPSTYATSSSSKFSSRSSSLATTRSSSPEREQQLTIDVSLQSISDGNSASSSSSNETVPDVATTTLPQQPDSTNQSYKYPPPFGQILGESGLGKTLLGANLSTLLTMIALANNKESIGSWGGVVCLLLLLGFLALLSAVLLKGIYPVIAMVNVLIGIGCSVAAICAYPLSGFLPHFWVMVLSSIAALSVTTPIVIIFCWKKCEREEC